MTKSVYYLPPTDAQIDQYAQQVCQRLAATQPELPPDTVHGFAHFLRVLFRLEARERNGEYAQVVDTDAD